MGLLRVDKPTGAEVVIILDDKAHFKIILGIRASDVWSLIRGWGLFLGLENLFKVPTTVAGLKETGGDDETVEFTFVVAFALFGVWEREGRDGIRGRTVGEAEGGVSVRGLGRGSLITVTPFEGILGGSMAEG